MKLHPLRIMRLEKELTQYHVALETGIPQVLLSLAERWYPALKDAQKDKLGKYFNTPVQVLFPEGDTCLER